MIAHQIVGVLPGEKQPKRYEVMRLHPSQMGIPLIDHSKVKPELNWVQDRAIDRQAHSQLLKVGD
jgi:hypothetical protein